MEITDEIIGCYIEGTATEEERIQVREYLCSHPEENEHLLFLMDNDTADFIGEQVEEEKLLIQESHNTFFNMDCCEAAISPMCCCMDTNSSFHDNQKEKLSSRLKKLWKELDSLPE